MAALTLRCAQPPHSPPERTPPPHPADPATHTRVRALSEAQPRPRPTPPSPGASGPRLQPALRAHLRRGTHSAVSSQRYPRMRTHVRMRARTCRQELQDAIDTVDISAAWAGGPRGRLVLDRCHPCPHACPTLCPGPGPGPNRCRCRCPCPSPGCCHSWARYSRPAASSTCSASRRMRPTRSPSCSPRRRSTMRAYGCTGRGVHWVCGRGSAGI